MLRITIKRIGQAGLLSSAYWCISMAKSYREGSMSFVWGHVLGILLLFLASAFMSEMKTD